MNVKSSISFTLGQISRSLLRGCLLVFLVVGHGCKDTTQKQDGILDKGSAVKIALLAFYHHTGRIPTDAEGIQALVERPDSQDIRELWKGPYLTRIPYDEAGHPLVYKNISSDDEIIAQISSLATNRTLIIKVAELKTAENRQTTPGSLAF